MRTVNAAGDPPFAKTKWNPKLCSGRRARWSSARLSHAVNQIVSASAWFYKVPVQGWQFKNENNLAAKTSVMIFITPKVLSDTGYVEDECDTVNLNKPDRCRNRK
jgi:hypothetical protein